MQITKNLDENFSFPSFFEGILKSINCNFWIQADFHGFFKSDKDKETPLVFQFGSRNSGILSHLYEKGFMVTSVQDGNDLVNFFSKKSYEDLRDLWFESHCSDIVNFEESGFAAAYMTTLLVTIEQIL